MSALKTYIAKVAAGTALSFEEAREAFDIIMSGDATPGQIGGFLMALRVRGETVSEISGAVATMRAKMLRVEAPAVLSISSARAATIPIASTFRRGRPSSSPPPVCRSPSTAIAACPR